MSFLGLVWECGDVGRGWGKGDVTVSKLALQQFQALAS